MLGFGNKKTTSTSTSSQQDTSQSQGQATSTSGVADWLQNPAQKLAGNLGGFIDQGPGAFTPQTNDLQNQGWDATGALVNPQFKGAYQALDQISQPGDVSGQSVLTGLDSYMSPYLKDVVDATLADYDAQAGQTTAQQAAAAAANKAFQGSRYGIQEAQTQGELARGRATTQSGLLNQGYGQAASMSDADANRRQQAALANQQNAAAYNQTLISDAAQRESLRNSIQNNARLNAGAQVTAGDDKFGINTAIQQYPLEYQKALSGLFQDIDPQLFATSDVKTSDSSTGTSTGTSTGKTTENPGLLSKLGQMVQIAGTAAAMSDRRVKRDIRTIGYDAKGRRWVSFAYLWAPLVRQVGVIAQEVLKTDPEAVMVGPNALLMVDYGRLA